MPVTINGSGSISGLAVGGLPDGSVDADTLAANAVTSAKIANSAVASSKLASGVGGKVLQIQKTLVTAQSQISCTSGSGLSGSHDSALAVSITPTSASNIIYINVFAFGEGNASSQARFSTRLKKVISGGSTSYFPAALGNRNPIFSKTGTSNENASNSPDSFAIPNFPDTAGTTSAITYTLQFMYDGGLSSAGQYNLNRIVADQNSTGYPNFYSWITATEVAA
tara:strand:+ start:19 stop:690 length:672 start_codon:yes stop_codon:yes gene_type:complete